MLYPNCPTCGFPLALVELNFEKEKEKICNDPNNTEEEIAKKISKLVKSLPLRRYCCKMRILTYINQAELIEPPENVKRVGI